MSGIADWLGSVATYAVEATSQGVQAVADAAS